MGPGPRLRVTAFVDPPLSRQVEVAVGAVDGQRHKQCHRHDHDQRGSHRITRGDADAGRSARSKVAEIRVDQQDRDRHQHGLQERPQQVDRVEERGEVMLIQATRLAEQDHGGELAGDERQDDGDRVQRGDRQHPGDDPGADQIRNRADRHRFQRVDFFVDPHGTQLRGNPGAKRGRQTDSRDDGRRDSNVDEGRQKPGQRLDADIAQRAVSLHRQRAAGGQRQESDDHQRPADHGQGTGAHADLGDQTNDFAPVVNGGEGYPGDRSAIEQRVIADSAEGSDRLLELSRQSRIDGSQLCHSVFYTLPSATWLTFECRWR